MQNDIPYGLLASYPGLLTTAFVQYSHPIPLYRHQSQQYCSVFSQSRVGVLPMQNDIPYGLLASYPGLLTTAFVA